MPLMNFWMISFPPPHPTFCYVSRCIFLHPAIVVSVVQFLSFLVSLHLFPCVVCCSLNLFSPFSHLNRLLPRARSTWWVIVSHKPPILPHPTPIDTHTDAWCVYVCVRTCDTPISPNASRLFALCVGPSPSSRQICLPSHLQSTLCHIWAFSISCHIYISSIKKSISLHGVKRGINLAPVAYLAYFIYHALSHILLFFLIPGSEAKRRGWRL